MRSRFKRWISTGIIIGAVFMLSGCLGTLFQSGSPKLMKAVRDGFEGEPDNCTKCHFLWARRFDYYHGWDRYGYLFDGKTIPGQYDAWYYPGLTNLNQEYYTTDWWNTYDINAWPDDIAGQAESMSILSRGNGLPDIPKRLEDIRGRVLVVAKSGGDFTSIQDAIDKAQPGTTVFVKSGEYNETLTLRNGISLIGEDAYTTIINPLNRGHALKAANNTVIANLTFTGTGIDYKSSTFNAAVYAAGTDSTCIIAGNIFRENGLFGVWIDGAKDPGGNMRFDDRHGSRVAEMNDRPYTDYPNPVIAGNIFYRIGQRAVFCVHSRGEVFNNIFIGNVKAMGLESHSRPLVHHNVFYFNNIPMAVNRSEPVVCNNIMYSNQWGQRMLRGANPVIFNNVTWKSPHYRDFDENGLPIYYKPFPGYGEIQVDPGFINPLECNFAFTVLSPLSSMTEGFSARGIMRDSQLPQPLTLTCKNSWGREVLAMSPEIVDLIEKIELENARIKNLQAAYRIEYKCYLDISPDEKGDIEKATVKSSDSPVVEVDYTVTDWLMDGSRRYKRYNEKYTIAGETKNDTGTIVYNGQYLEARGGRFAAIYDSEPDSRYVGERPFREAPGGFYRDYDQYVKGAMGVTGTFYQGFLRIMGGVIFEDTRTIDGHECIIVRYPHIGKDQYFMFYLDPAIGYRPRKMEQFYNEKLCRVVDSYRYKECGGGIHLPVSLDVTDYGLSKSCKNKVIATCRLTVDEDSIKVNEDIRKFSQK
ncbi:nitrous oxide reductase family maturation protein NosD [Candidatus Latescibacterota bacterium]